MTGVPARIGSVENRRIIIILLDLLGLQRRAVRVSLAPILGRHRLWAYIHPLSQPAKPPLPLPSPVDSILRHVHKQPSPSYVLRRVRVRLSPVLLLPAQAATPVHPTRDILSSNRSQVTRAFLCLHFNHNHKLLSRVILIHFLFFLRFLCTLH